MTNHRLFCILPLNSGVTQERQILLHIFVSSNSKIIRLRYKIVINLLIMFVDIHYANSLNSFLINFPRQLPLSDRIQHPIDLTVGHKIPPRKLYRQLADKLAETKQQIDEYLFKLDIFDHQTALLALQYYS